MQNGLGKALDSRLAVEWQTVLLVVLCWAAYGLLTYFWRELGWWMVAPLGGYVLCLYGSLQHEAVHAHPTRSALLNEALVHLPIGLLFPFRRYKAMHLTHHNNDHLTDPVLDPESYYMEPEDYDGQPLVLKWLYAVNNSLLGRLIIGPTLTTICFLSSEVRLIAGGDRRIAVIWLVHLVGVGVVWLWVSGVCGMPFWQYLIGMAYWGLSFTLLRSFAEHRAHEQASCRTIVVETNPVIALMFLNNNLHMAHHERPGLAWYALPSFYRENRDRLLHDNCGYLIKGYRQLLRDFAVRPKEAVPHPLPDSLKR